MSENLPTTLQCNDNDSNYLECAKHLLLIISERINNKTKEIENLKNTIYTGGADIAKVGNIMGSGALPPSTNSVKKALESINGDFVGSFKETSKAIWELHNIQSEVLKLFKIFILCLGQITSNINRDKQSHKKAVDRLNQVTSRIEQGEINVSELIDIFAENVKEEVEEYQLLEEKITNLSNNQADFIALIKEQTSNAVSEIEKKQEELSTSLRDGQASAISNLKKAIEDNLSLINDKSEKLSKSQEVFISQSKEQSSQALSLIREEANAKVAMMKEKTEKFMDDHETQYLEMKKQLKTYKIITIIAAACAVASVICSLLL